MQKLLGLRNFNNLPHVHNGYPVSHVPCDHQVVSDVQIGHPHVLARLLHQLHDRHAAGNIQHGGRLVGNHQVGSEDQRTGDCNPLPLSTRKIMGITKQKSRSRRESNLRQKLGNQLQLIQRIPDLLHYQGLRDDVVYRQPWIQRFVRVLEDQLLLTPEASHLPSLQLGRINGFICCRILSHAGKVEEYVAGCRLQQLADDCQVALPGSQTVYVALSRSDFV